MAINRIALIGLSILGLTATALAQNTSNPLRSGNTTNPISSGNTVTNGPEVPISPALPTTILAPTIGRNSINGLPCTAGAVVDPAAALNFRLDSLPTIAKRLRLIAVVLKPPALQSQYD